ncbi:hypothetical protein QQF64_020925 [Cirrhinus molitorella]|uniref:Uncharacterized protein n=1 Tax=Cirrhinus molitorella TaxID=172907 RepID=A0ABR3LAJ0_9TELE
MEGNKLVFFDQSQKAEDIKWTMKALWMPPYAKHVIFSESTKPLHYELVSHPLTRYLPSDERFHVLVSAVRADGGTCVSINRS